MATIEEREAQCERIEDILGLTKNDNKEERAETFRYAVKKLRAIQHEIDDCAQVAALELNKLRARYNYWFESFKPFLRDYWQENAAVDKDGVKAKHLRTLDAGGGVFFTAKTVSPKVSADKLEELHGLLIDASCNAEIGGPEFDIRFKVEQIVAPKTVYEVKDLAKLLEALRYLDTDPKDYGIEEGSSDPLGHMYVGTERGWTPNKLKERLNKALEGELPEVQG